MPVKESKTCTNSYVSAFVTTFHTSTVFANLNTSTNLQNKILFNSQVLKIFTKLVIFNSCNMNTDFISTCSITVFQWQHFSNLDGQLVLVYLRLEGHFGEVILGQLSIQLNVGKRNEQQSSLSFSQCQVCRPDLYLRSGKLIRGSVKSDLATA